MMQSKEFLVKYLEVLKVPDRMKVRYLGQGLIHFLHIKHV